MRKSLIISVLIIIIPITAFAKYRSNENNLKILAQIAEPIIRVENIDETIRADFYQNTTQEYKFKVKNYYVTGAETRVSEISFIYNIEIKQSNSNFPANYELYNSKNEKILLDDNLKTNNIFIEKNEIYEEEYKLIVSWKNIDNLSSNVDTNVLVNVLQYKES